MIKFLLGIVGTVAGIRHHRQTFSSGRQSSGDNINSVMICKGSFSARRSVCSSLSAATKDVIPSELWMCSEPVTPGEMSEVFSGSSSGSLKLDFSSPGSLQLSLTSLETRRNVLVSYGDCNSASSLPDLEDGASYFAILLLDKNTAKDSLTLNSQSLPGSARIDLQTSVNILDVKLFSDSTLSSKLAADFSTCENAPTSVCSPGTMYNPQIVRVPHAMVELDKWF